MEWINAQKQLPTNKGYYLVIIESFLHRVFTEKIFRHKRTEVYYNGKTFETNNQIVTYWLKE